VNTPRTLLVIPLSNLLSNTKICATSVGSLDGNVSSQVIRKLVGGDVGVVEVRDGALASHTVAVGLVTDVPTGSSITTSSAIRAS